MVSARMRVCLFLEDEATSLGSFFKMYRFATIQVIYGTLYYCTYISVCSSMLRTELCRVHSRGQNQMYKL